MKLRLSLLSLLICAVACFGHRSSSVPGEHTWLTTPADSLLAEQILATLKQHAEEPVSALMVRAGKALDGQPYVAGTLEETPHEQLAIYLTRTDCILFVETCLALARTAKSGGGFPELAGELRRSRYRDGQVTGFADRLHYTLEWARQGIGRGTLKDMTPALGGEVYDHPIHFMSSHPASYPHMDDVEAIRAAEERINAQPFLQIPKSRLGAALPGIRSGDIICLVSATEGLDIAHVGLALVEPDGTVRFLHASSNARKVILDPKPLPAYLSGRRSLTGIQVYRPL